MLDIWNTAKNRSKSLAYSSLPSPHKIKMKRALDGSISFPPLKVAMGLLSLFPLIAKKNDSETLFYVKINWICD